MDVQDKAYKNFLVVWLGQLMSAIGSGLTAFALGLKMMIIGDAGARRFLLDQTQ